MLILFAGLCLGSYLLETIGLEAFMNGIAFKKSSKELALLAGKCAFHDSRLASFGYEQSLPYYTGKRVMVVGDRGELEFGSRQGNQAAWFIDESAFRKLWQEKRQLIVLIKGADYDRIAPQLVPAATVLGQKGRKMLICNQPVMPSGMPSCQAAHHQPAR